MTRRARLTLGVLLAVTAAIRIGLILLDVPALTHDSYVYMRQAAAIRNGEWQNAVPNGYPLLLATIPRAIGSGSFIRAAQMLNVLFAVGTTLLIVLTARRFAYGERAALAAAGLVALWPHQINYARLMLTECATTFLIALAVWGAMANRGPVTGLALGICSLVRTTCMPMMVALPWVAIATWRDAAKALVVAAATVAVFVLAASPSGHAGLGTNLPMSLEVARMSEDGNSRFDIQHLNLRDAARAYLGDALASPMRFVKQRAQSLNELWGPWPIENGRDTLSRIAIGLRFPFVLLALVGWWRLPSRQAKWATAIPVLTITLIHVALFSMARFSEPLEPLLLLLAVGAFVRESPAPC